MSFAKVQTQSRELNQVQSNIATFLQTYATNPLLNGAFVNDQDLISGSTVIYHNLGRQLQGWIVTNIDGSASIYSTGFDDSTLTLSSSAAVTVNLYVF